MKSTCRLLDAILLRNHQKGGRIFSDTESSTFGLLPNHTLSLLSKNGSLKIVHEDTTTTTTTTQPISNITLDKPIKTVISSSLTTALIDFSGSVFTYITLLTGKSSANVSNHFK